MPKIYPAIKDGILFTSHAADKVKVSMLIERTDYEFLLLVNKFCNKIDRYRILLNLEENKVEELKNESDTIRAIIGKQNNSSADTETFIRHKLQNIRVNFSHMAQCCKNSKSYTFSIGIDLGVEIPVYAFQAN